jgi:coenzyme F420 hydrogenase subunit beta
MSAWIVQNLHVINQIVDRDLCVRCGACEPACPVDIIRFDTATGFPYVTDEPACLQGCTRCLKVCPGEDVEFNELDDQMFGLRPHPSSVTGIARRALVSYATDDAVRYEGASGGFVTALLQHMLESGEIDGALVLGVTDERGAWEQKPFIARTAAELRLAAKSKYLAVPFLRPLEEMERIEGNYAIVALPCYVHAIRKYQKVSRLLRERIKLVVGLYCNVVFEPHLFVEACEQLDVDPRDVSDFRFRHGDWPGGVFAVLKDGTERKVLKFEEMKDEFNVLKLLYAAPRCNMCTDFSAEYADIAVGDPWLRGPDGQYLFEDGRTTVLVRTEAGEEAVQRAVEARWLAVREIPLETWMVNFEYSGRYKRDFVPKNLELRRLAGLPAPRYDRELPLAASKGWLKATLRTVIRSLGRYKWFRRPAVKLAQSRPAIAYLRWNRARKAGRFTTEFDRRMAFVQRLNAGLTSSPGTENGDRPTVPPLHATRAS